MTADVMPPGFEDLEAARRLLDGVTRVTPVIESSTLGAPVDARVVLKAENLQRTGSFKLRGGYTRVAALDAEGRERGVVAASAGNHAQGLGRAATMLGVSATIFMPADASLAKVTATRRYGATVRLEGDSFDAAQVAARQYAASTGATFVSAFDDRHVVAGQGTLGLELVEQIPDADIVVVPCGGGGLLAGVAIALRARRSQVRIVGVQAAGCASFARSRRAGAPIELPRAQTIADGIAVKRPGDLTYPLVQALVDEIVTVPDDAIVAAMALLLERHKLLVEGAGAVGVAAVMTGAVSGMEGRCVAVVLSGGNIDLPLVQAVIRSHLTATTRYLRFRTRLPDRPGSLMRLLDLLSVERVNIVDIVHHRAGIEMLVTDTEVELTLETRGGDHAAVLLDLVRAGGYPVETTG